jgi:uncharacterized membrane protein YbhN (UPF0104 family)
MTAALRAVPTSRSWFVARLVLFAAITAAIVIAARRIDWGHAMELLATARGGWIGMAVLANAGILACWAAFWRLLRPDAETPVGYGRMFEIVSSASSLMNTLPFGGGHASSVVLLMRRGNTTQRGALSVLALDQLGEGVTKLSLFLLVAALAPLPTWMRAGVLAASLGVAALLVVMMVASRWTSQLAILTSGKRSATALCCVLAMKSAEALAIAAVQHAFGVDLPVSGTLLVLAAVVLGTMLPLAPGNLGTYEASAFLAYRYLGVGPEQALSLAIMQHVCFMLPSVGIGYLYLSAQTLSRSAAASR